MSTENNIVYLEVEHIFPHPSNPRKDLGDLTELAESIKANGIMQNLTVVRQPWSVNDTKPINYTAIIGHRRLAAAKLAGLKEVPCIISELDEKTQVATMLLENMQRSDLTVIEQAQGFQMMMDMGETVQTIAKKTGFSGTTVRKRLFVAGLDADKSKSAYERGATLEDYLKLQQLTDDKKRNEVLESIGTNNFDYKLKNAIAEELRDRVAPEMIKEIEAFAKPTDKACWELKGYGTYHYCHYTDFEKTGAIGIKVPKKWKPDEFLYCVSLNNIAIYRQREDVVVEKKMSELPPEEQEKRREKRRKLKALKEAGETAYLLRAEFVKNFTQKSALNAAQLEALSDFAFAAVCLGDRLDFALYAMLEGLQVESRYGMTFLEKRAVMKAADAPATRVLLAALYSIFRDSSENTYFCGAEALPNKKGQHKVNHKLDAIYDCLCALGYQMSDEETSLRNGTHEMLLPAES